MNIEQVKKYIKLNQDNKIEDFDQIVDHKFKSGSFSVQEIDSLIFFILKNNKSLDLNFTKEEILQVIKNCKRITNNDGSILMNILYCKTKEKLDFDKNDRHVS